MEMPRGRTRVEDTDIHTAQLSKTKKRPLPRHKRRKKYLPLRTPPLAQLSLFRIIKESRVRTRTEKTDTHTAQLSKTQKRLFSICHRRKTRRRR